MPLASPLRALLPAFLVVAASEGSEALLSSVHRCVLSFVCRSSSWPLRLRSRSPFAPCCAPSPAPSSLNPLLFLRGIAAAVIEMSHKLRSERSRLQTSQNMSPDYPTSTQSALSRWSMSLDLE